jgi:hypothetical protein
MIVRINLSGVFAIRRWSEVSQAEQGSNAFARGIETEQKRSATRLPLRRPDNRHVARSGASTSDEPTYAFIRPVWLDNGNVLVATAGRCPHRNLFFAEGLLALSSKSRCFKTKACRGHSGSR